MIGHVLPLYFAIEPCVTGLNHLKFIKFGFYGLVRLGFNQKESSMGFVFFFVYFFYPFGLFDKIV